MKLRAPLLAVAILPLLAGCGDSVFGPDEREALAAAEVRWAQARPANYRFEIRLSCFCGNVYGEFTRLDVRSDSVVAATFVTPQPIPDPPVVGWYTVDQLFSLVRGLAATAREETYLTDVSVSYDATYGYPTRIEVRCSDNVSDCGSTTLTRNLQPLVP